MIAYALKWYDTPRLKEPTDWLKLPTPLPMDTWLTPVPPMRGSVFADDNETTTPRSLTVAPPSAVTSPPSVAEVAPIEAAAALVTVGAVRLALTVKLPDHVNGVVLSDDQFA